MKKILLINPAYKGEVLWDVRQMPPLGLGILAALTPEEYEIKIVDENVSDLNFNEDVNLVAITSMTYNAPRAYEIAQIYKEKNIPVIMGGIHVSMLPNEALKYCSTVIIGEAENIWKQILKEFESGRLQQIYKGSSASLDDVPFPRRDLFSKKYKIQIVQASRGCPFSCEFCSVSKFANGEYKRRPVANVIKEISMLKDKRFVFADDNLMGYGKSSEQYLMNLFKDLKHLNKKWGTQLSWNIADNDNILKHAAESGAMGFFVGFESINEATLKGMGKGINLKMGIKNYKRLIKKIHDYGISVTGAFIFGNDEDEKSTFRKTLDFIYDIELDRIQFTIATPLPGTRFYDRLAKEGRLLYTDYPNDWKKHDMYRATFKPKKMTIMELEQGFLDAYEFATSRKSSFLSALKTLKNTRNIAATLTSYPYNRRYGKAIQKNLKMN